MFTPKGRGYQATTAFMVILAIIILTSCQDRKSNRFTTVVLPNGRTIRAELAITDKERTRGAMFRESILPDQGMLFVFDREDHHLFWMKNTPISLDILWLDRGRRVVHIEASVPPCKEDPCPLYRPKAPALYVLELKAW